MGSVHSGSNSRGIVRVQIQREFKAVRSGMISLCRGGVWSASAPTCILTLSILHIRSRPSRCPLRRHTTFAHSRFKGFQNLFVKLQNSCMESYRVSHCYTPSRRAPEGINSCMWPTSNASMICVLLWACNFCRRAKKTAKVCS